MLFQKPKDMKYTDMCIYVDKIVARGNPTEAEQNTIFQYLYHIAFMLAHKQKYFNASHYYDEFAIYFATSVMQRLFYNPRLSEVDENGDPVLAPIKSVLNYMKNVCYPRKVEFEQENYSQKYTETFDTREWSQSFNRDPYEEVKETDILFYLRDLPKTIKYLIYEHNFYKNDKVMMKNIYLSCLLSFLNIITFSEADKEKFETAYTSVDAKYRLLAKIYAKNRTEGIILYHLDAEYEDYIRVLVNKIFRYLKQDIMEISNQYTISDEVMTNILFLEVNGETTTTE